MITYFLLLQDRVEDMNVVEEAPEHALGGGKIDIGRHGPSRVLFGLPIIFGAGSRIQTRGKPKLAERRPLEDGLDVDEWFPRSADIDDIGTQAAAAMYGGCSGRVLIQGKRSSGENNRFRGSGLCQQSLQVIQPLQDGQARRIKTIVSRISFQGLEPLSGEEGKEIERGLTWKDRLPGTNSQLRAVHTRRTLVEHYRT